MRAARFEGFKIVKDDNGQDRLWRLDDAVIGDDPVVEIHPASLGEGSEPRWKIVVIHRTAQDPHEQGQTERCELPGTLSFDEAVQVAPHALFGRPGEPAVIGKTPLNEIAVAVEESWNDAFLWMQQAMGVATGDVAGMFFTGRESDEAFSATLRALPPALWKKVPRRVGKDSGEGIGSGLTPFSVGDDDIRAVARRFAGSMAKQVGMPDDEDGIDALSGHCEDLLKRYVEMERSYCEAPTPKC